ncbi:uncharacterized protein LAESUDRAFT_726064 [Laetiporus sulphureus 93-53]|uniref:Uncharacterized protein n=1 Tax=Laetiporus sulphureus 93-53 TaxID=1314785 RepID=A0A165E4U2_9APHY|nr:uncharacterized protein LAESUDRAFT_726064 [Laetiporus sulphureus 93-53]KZT06243.1 hypothetical protein LAESUDRAFT_726064 [Laetiporus sulphureus 93-53]
MWCTRWYLPLVLLPFPIAPPYFLLLFLLSTTMHARPCFYCIVLLSAMFVSSCYWPPVPLETALTMPWSENITTYGDALLSLLPDLPEDMMPTDVPMLDRCWCDLSSTKLFEPFNVTQWELNSVEKLKDELEHELNARRQMELAAQAAEAKREEPPEENEHESTPDAEAAELVRHAQEATEKRQGSMLSHVWNAVTGWSISRKANTSTDTTPPTSPHLSIEPVPTIELPSHQPTLHSGSRPPVDPGSKNSTSVPTSGEERSRPETPKLPLLRREYDLRPYGFALIIDFGWSTSHS